LEPFKAAIDAMLKADLEPENCGAPADH